MSKDFEVEKHVEDNFFEDYKVTSRTRNGATISIVVTSRAAAQKLAEILSGEMTYIELHLNTEIIL